MKFSISCDHGLYKKIYPGNNFKLLEKNFNERLGRHQKSEKGDVYVKPLKQIRYPKEKGHITERAEGYDLLVYYFV